MRFNVAAAAASAALLAGGVSADDAQKVLKDESSSTVAEAATSVSPVKLPTFTVSSRRQCSPSPQTASNQCIRIAYQAQGSLPRAVYRRLGLALEAFPRQEGDRPRYRGGVGLRRRVVRRGARRLQGHGGRQGSRRQERGRPPRHLGQVPQEDRPQGQGSRCPV